MAGLAIQKIQLIIWIWFLFNAADGKFYTSIVYIEEALTPLILTVEFYDFWGSGGNRIWVIDDIIDFHDDMFTPNFNFLIFARKASKDWIDLAAIQLDKLSQLAINMIVNSKSQLLQNEPTRQKLIYSIVNDNQFYNNYLHENYSAI